MNDQKRKFEVDIARIAKEKSDQEQQLKDKISRLESDNEYLQQHSREVQVLTEGFNPKKFLSDIVTAKCCQVLCVVLLATGVILIPQILHAVLQTNKGVADSFLVHSDLMPQPIASLPPDPHAEIVDEHIHVHSTGPTSSFEKHASQSPKCSCPCCEKPTIPCLQAFPVVNGTSKSVNIIDELGPSSDFFYQLLDDDKGTIVATTENDQRVQNVRHELFRKWMQGTGGKPVTWETLIKALRDSRLITLADTIETSRSSLC